jgi:hypothetical protein
MARAKSKASLAKAIQGARSRIAERPDNFSLWEIMCATTANPNDRSLALVFGSIIEQILEDAIASHFIQMDDKGYARFFGPPEEAPITFDVKIRLGYALGIYGNNSRSDLTCIRHIRNVFAHSKTEITFDSDEITRICDELKYIDFVPWGGMLGQRPKTSRDKFVMAVNHFYIYFVSGRENLPIRYSDNLLGALFS